MCKKSVPSCLGSKLKMAVGAGLIRYLEKQKKNGYGYVKLCKKVPTPIHKLKVLHCTKIHYFMASSWWLFRKNDLHSCIGKN